MNRALTTLFGTLSLVLLSGCMSGDDAAAPQGTTGVAGTASTQKGGMPKSLVAPIVFGSFDANAPDFQLFKPCEEIPAEVYREIGMGEMVSGPSSIGIGQYCGFGFTTDGGDVLDFGSSSDILQDDQAPKGDIKILPGVTKEGVKIDRIQYPDDTADCVTSVMTNRGRWTLDFYSSEGSMKERACEILYDFHASLIKYVKGEQWN